MPTSPPPDNHTELERLVNLLIDQGLTDGERSQLRRILQQSPEAVRQYKEIIETHQALCEVFPNFVLEAPLRHVESTTGFCRPTVEPANRRHHSGRPWPPPYEWVALCLAVCLIGGTGYLLGWSESPTRTQTGRSDAATLATESLKAHAFPQSPESTLSGHGVIRKTIDARWPEGVAPKWDGSLLSQGEFLLHDGIAVLDFFSGATLVVAGPARLDVVSDWVVTVHEGRVEATVPPAAQGFIVRAADTEIVDLGTRFAIAVSSNSAQVRVIDGEILLRTETTPESLLKAGDQAVLAGSPQQKSSLEGIPSLDAIHSRSTAAANQRLQNYETFIGRFAADPRLVAWYTPLSDITRRFHPNVAANSTASQAQVIGPVETVPGRLGTPSTGLAFTRPGSRCRMKIAGSFNAFTFCCWAKIDSLPHRFNALFLADGYENGEPHWQIREDGRLMLSVMVDDSRELIYPAGPNQSPIRDAGFHHVYFSEPIWDETFAGRWMHLAAVYAPEARLVTHYVNGQEVSREDITDEFFIDELRIGAAEFGNWGQPFRKTPEFAVRNIDGVIDELMVFNAALSEAEIHDLYQKGRPE